MITDIKAIVKMCKRRKISLDELANIVGRANEKDLIYDLAMDNFGIREIKAIQEVLQFERPERVFFADR